MGFREPPWLDTATPENPSDCLSLRARLKSDGAMPDAAVVMEAPEASENTRISERLRRYAALLERQGMDGYRVRAYRAAASEIDTLSEPLSDHLHRGGVEGLIRLRGIGRGIAAAIVEMLTTGTWRQLDRLEGELAPERLFATIPSIGAVLAKRLAGMLEHDTLEHLAADLRSGEADVPGIGPRRRAAILAVLEQRLSRLPAVPDLHFDTLPEPPVSLLLDVDALYRCKASAGTLRRIAPRRFNPNGEAWLPILETRLDGWNLKALYSNTARARRLDRVLDWVVISFHRDHGRERHCTVVTETHGALAGKRVIRGREEECRAHYKTALALEAT
jgi:hypothetical protein